MVALNYAVDPLYDVEYSRLLIIREDKDGAIHDVHVDGDSLLIKDQFPWSHFPIGYSRLHVSFLKYFPLNSSFTPNLLRAIDHWPQSYYIYNYFTTGILLDGKCVKWRLDHQWHLRNLEKTNVSIVSRLSGRDSILLRTIPCDSGKLSFGTLAAAHRRKRQIYTF